VLDNSLTVADVMTKDLVTLNMNDKLSTADDVMRLGRIRHLLVVDDEGALVGILSQRDLFHSGLLKALGFGTRGAQQALDTLAIKEATHTKVTTTSPDCRLREAARIMCEKKIGCLPVLKDGKLVGILTEGDFTLLVAGQKAIS
jgi:CBS domain-containing membrane protein